MDAKRLASIPLFAELKSSERQVVARWADEVDVPEGKHVVDRGDFAYEFFVIEDGTAEVVDEGRRLGELGPGDFFGEVGLLGREGRRTASVVATSPLRVIVMHKRDFRAMDRAMPHLAEKIRAACYLRLPGD